MNAPTIHGLSKLEFDVLSAVRNIRTHYPQFGIGDAIPQQEGWVTSARVRETLGTKSLETRRTLQHLAIDGLLQEMEVEKVQMFRLSGQGERFLGEPHASDERSDRPIRAESESWTGILELPQIRQVLQIVSEIEDVAENMRGNVERAQILGLIGALKILLDLPDAPRAGIIELVRDPAFANIIQVATLLAAIVAVLRA